VSVGDYGLFAAYTYLVGGGHAFDEAGVPILQQERVSKGIRLGANVWLGAGAKVMDGVSIGRDVVVGAGAVVTSDLPDRVVAAGVPARIVRQREPETTAAR
jgi:acetyltransferase-like isoleucine patch superfamily enzyme